MRLWNLRYVPSGPLKEVLTHISFKLRVKAARSRICRLLLSSLEGHGSWLPKVGYYETHTQDLDPPSEDAERPLRRIHPIYYPPRDTELAGFYFSCQELSRMGGLFKPRSA